MAGMKIAYQHHRSDQGTKIFILARAICGRYENCVLAKQENRDIMDVSVHVIDRGDK